MIFSNMKNESKKAVPTVHSDIEGWLKSVDALSKDLKELLDAKKRVAAKMDSIKKKYKSEKQKSQEEEKPQEEKDKNYDGKRIRTKKSTDDKLEGDVAKTKSKPKPKPSKSIKSGKANIGDESDVELSDDKEGTA